MISIGNDEFDGSIGKERKPSPSPLGASYRIDNRTERKAKFSTWRPLFRRICPSHHLERALGKVHYMITTLRSRRGDPATEAAQEQSWHVGLQELALWLVHQIIGEENFVEGS